jgi:hypothetical protein
MNLGRPLFASAAQYIKGDTNEASLRFSVFLQWTWTYISGKRAERLINRNEPAIETL